MKKTIRVYDDTTHLGEKYVEKLKALEVVRKTFDKIESISHKDFKRELGELGDRQVKTRSDKKWDKDSMILDETSIFVVDYDLLKEFKETFLTGENIAYLARCFSTCGLIIGLNQFIKLGDNRFDLTMKGHLESFCDLNIENKQLDNLGLWGDEKKEFRPWYWPHLPDYLTCFEKKVNEIIDDPNQTICEVLGIEEVVKAFPRSALEFLGREPEKTTVKKFVTKSGNGLRARDNKPTDAMVARIAVARLSKWLERVVLPGQDILVDAPHLVSRYPSLLTGDHSNIDNWNKTTSFDAYDRLGLNHELIEEFRFENIDWISRPVWFWGKVSNCQKIKEVKEPWEKERIEYVFCEDASSFYRREDCKEFIIKSESPYVRRFIRHFRNAGIQYEPRARLL